MKKRLNWRFYNMEKAPDRLYIDESTRDLYEKIKDESIFKGKNRKEQFLFAMAVGFINKIKVPIKKTEGLFLVKDLKSEDEALINAIAIYDKASIDVLSDKVQVYRIAEEYANGGIRILAEKVDSTQFGAFEKVLEKELFEMYKNITL